MLDIDLICLKSIKADPLWSTAMARWHGYGETWVRQYSKTRHHMACWYQYRYAGDLQVPCFQGELVSNWKTKLVLVRIELKWLTQNHSNKSKKKNKACYYHTHHPFPLKKKSSFSFTFGCGNKSLWLIVNVMILKTEMYEKLQGNNDKF